MSIEWESVQKVLVVRLRSIGDTVLTTPSLISLREFLPDAEIDILLEDWVAPVLDGFEGINHVVRVSKKIGDRVKLARKLRSVNYDVVINLHGGTTSTFFTRASGAKYRVGYSNYRYSFLYTHRLNSPSRFWRRKKTHSAEQQMALFGFAGVPVKETQKTQLNVASAAAKSLGRKIFAESARTETPKKYRGISGVRDPRKELNTTHFEFALIHPAAAFETKQWAYEKFAKVVEYLGENSIETIAVATKNERGVLDRLASASTKSLLLLDNLSLPEIVALASKAKIFIGNDSGIAHIASAVNTRSVVVFGSSNRSHWHPWTNAPFELVYEELECQPCPGYECKEFGKPKCILSVKSESVIEAVGRILHK